MSESQKFIQTFKEQFQELYDITVKNSYKLLVPLSKYINASMLNKNFYENHIFFVSKYDESIYINLQGRIFQIIDNKLKTAIPWKGKNLEFSLRESYSNLDLNCISIDNVCDLSSYNISNKDQGRSSTETFKKCQNMEEYIKYYSNFPNLYKEYTNAKKELDQFIDVMRNKIILLKGYEDDYRDQFSNRIISVQESFKGVLIKNKIDDNLSSVIVNELTDSLIFSQLYDYVYPRLVEFYEEEEKEFKQKLKETPDAMDKLEESYRECKFESPLQLLHKLKEYHTVFEKMNLIEEINKEMGEEAKKVYEEKKEYQKYNPQGDTLINFWSYLVSHSDADNLIAEAVFLKIFSSVGNKFSQSYYLATNFIAAVDNLQFELLDKDKRSSIVTQNIKGTIITTQTLGQYGSKKGY